MNTSRVALVVTVVVAIFVTTTVSRASVLQASAAVIGATLMIRIGWAMISGLANPVPEPPDPGELRKVKLSYRCAICGAEVRMTAAASEDPEPPRHCLEDMDLMTPFE